ncbi:MAG TPA: hypothetical protein VHA35_21485 [Dongiaceae bacterium]|nr:hypothetical protein [Dongiaceae bacterium]
MSRRQFTALTAGAATAFGGLAKARADAQGFFDGQTIEWVVPFAPGGGTDVRSRFHVPWLKKYLKGSVNILIENEPGAGSVSGTNEYYLRREHNGLNVLSTGGSTNIAVMMQEPAVQFNYLNMIPIAGFPVGSVWYVASDTGIKTPADLLHPAKPLHYAGVSASGRDLSGLLAFDLFGLDVQVTLGHDGGGSTRLAFERGESNFDMQTTTAFRQSVAGDASAGNAVPLYTDGVLDEHGEVVRDPTWPDLPSVREVYTTLRGKEPSGPEWDAYKIALGTRGALNLVIWMHSDAPKQAVDEFTQAFRDMSKDPEYQKQLNEQTGGYPVIIGADVLEPMVKTSFDIDPKVIDWLFTWLEQKYDVPRPTKG